MGVAHAGECGTAVRQERTSSLKIGRHARTGALKLTNANSARSGPEACGGEAPARHRLGREPGRRQRGAGRGEARGEVRPGRAGRRPRPDAQARRGRTRLADRLAKWSPEVRLGKLNKLPEPFRGSSGRSVRRANDQRVNGVHVLAHVDGTSACINPGRAARPGDHHPELQRVEVDVGTVVGIRELDQLVKQCGFSPSRFNHQASLPSLIECRETQLRGDHRRL